MTHTPLQTRRSGTRRARPRASRWVLWAAPLLLPGLLVGTAVFVGCAASAGHYETENAPRPGFASAPEPGRPPPASSWRPGGAAAGEEPYSLGSDLRSVRAPRPDARALVSAEALPTPDEELWVIERPEDRAKALASDQPPGPGRDDQMPGGGSLMTRDPKTQQPVPVPLKHTDVKASIAGYVATVDVTQQYHNPYDGKIEAVYVFPLPHNAAVNEFLMTVGERKIRGIIRERQEAQRIYEAARTQGYVASLMTQERPNIFTQAVANIEPGKGIDITIRYFHTLAYQDGWYEYVFPMVVGPRFNPPGFGEGVGAVPHGAPGTSGQRTEVQYLRPEQRGGHDIALAVHIDAGVPIEQIDSISHQVHVKPAPAHDANPAGVANASGAINATGAGAATSTADVTLDVADTIPNKDFVLRYKVAGKAVKSAVMVRKEDKGDGKGGYFTLMIFPPETLNDLPRKPLEMVFTVDVSGSQSGEPIEQEKAAVKWALAHLGPEDTFQVVRFGNTAQKLAPVPLPADRSNLTRAAQWVEGFQAGGGTLLIEGLHASLNFPHDPSRLRFVSFFTDGFIGNDAQALGETARCLGPSRIFSFGVCAAPNRYLLNHMAKLGNGAVAYVPFSGDHARNLQLARETMAQFFTRVSHPALTDVRVDFGGMKVRDVFPRRVPDLFVGRPIILTGRYTGGGATTIRVSGKAGNEETTFEVPVNLDDASASHPGIAAVWARNKIADLADRATYEPAGDPAGQIRQIALEYGLLSHFTAFVAVDSSTRTAGDHGTTVAVPVPVPTGTRYDTTVGQ